MPVLILLPYVILSILAALVIWSSVRLYQWSTGPGPTGRPSGGRRAAGVSLSALLLFAVAYPFVRDAYRNMLCTEHGGARVVIGMNEWHKRHGAEVSAVVPSEARNARTKISPDVWRESLNSRFSEETTSRSRGLGVKEHTQRIIDTANGSELAIWTRFSTGETGRRLTSIGLPMSNACFAGGPEYLDLRKQLSRLGKSD